MDQLLAACFSVLYNKLVDIAECGYGELCAVVAMLTEVVKAMNSSLGKNMDSRVASLSVHHFDRTLTPR